MTSELLLSSFIETLHVIINDFKQEQAIAKTFLSTLSQSLVSIKQKVQSTSALNADSRVQHNNLNDLLQMQIVEITETIKGPLGTVFVLIQTAVIKSKLFLIFLIGDEVLFKRIRILTISNLIHRMQHIMVAIRCSGLMLISLAR